MPSVRMTAMQYSERDLRGAASAGAISGADLERLLTFFAEGPPPVPPRHAAAVAKFDVANLLWYAGALIVIGAMGLFSTLAFSQMGGRALTFTAIFYAVAFARACHCLW